MKVEIDIEIKVKVDIKIEVGVDVKIEVELDVVEIESWCRSKYRSRYSKSR